MFVLLYCCFQPSGYISHLIGHEGSGSLLSALKARGWSNQLVAGIRPAARGMGFFGISVDLTEEGIDHINDIIKLVFQVSSVFGLQYLMILQLIKLLTGEFVRYFSCIVFQYL